MKGAPVAFADVAATKAAGEVLYQDLRTRPLHERQYRFLRYARRNYRDGLFYAAAETVADALGCARSTVQSDAKEMEARGLWEVIPHPLASGRIVNAVVFAPGTLYALRKLEADRIDWKRAAKMREVLAKLPDLPSHASEAASAAEALPNEREVVHPTNRRKDTEYPTSTSCSQRHSTSLLFEKNTNTSTPRASEENACDKKRDDGAGVFEKRDDEGVTQALAAPAVAPRAESSTSAMIAMLEVEGVSLGRARKLVREFSLDRIGRNLAMGAHRFADNPGAYLAAAIVDDYERAGASRPGAGKIGMAALNDDAYVRSTVAAMEARKGERGASKAANYYQARQCTLPGAAEARAEMARTIEELSGLKSSTSDLPLGFTELTPENCATVFAATAQRRERLTPKRFTGDDIRREEQRDHDEAMARLREHQAAAPASIATTSVNPPSANGMPKTGQETPSEAFSQVEPMNTTPDPLEGIPEPEKAVLRARAIAELDERHAFMGSAWKHEGPAFEGMVRGRMRKLFDLANAALDAEPSPLPPESPPPGRLPRDAWPTGPIPSGTLQRLTPEACVSAIRGTLRT